MVAISTIRRDQAPLGVVRRFVTDTSGGTAIEYALVAGGIGVAVASTIWSLGGTVKTMLYDKMAALF